MKPMGFYLWLDTEVAWAQGTYEYRPMGAAVIASSDLFRRRDFDPRRQPAPARSAVYAGQFASLGHLNAHLKRARPARRTSGPGTRRRSAPAPTRHAVPRRAPA
jgi:hypothetical protein